MRIFVTTVGGDLVATLDADPVWSRSELLCELGDTPQDKRRRLLHGAVELLPGHTLDTLGVKDGAQLTLVMEQALITMGMGGPCYVEGHGQPEVTDNFHVQRFVLRGVEFYCVEQAFQAMKFKDPIAQAAVSSLRPDPGLEATAFGRQCCCAGQDRHPSFRTEWDGVKAEVMYRASRAKFIQNSDSASKLLATGESAVTWPDNLDGFWAIWNCYIIRRIRIELKPPAQRSQTEISTLQMIESKFDLQACILGGEDTISSSEFNASCPKEPYAHESRAFGCIAAAGVETLAKDIVPDINRTILALFEELSTGTDGTLRHADAKAILVGVGVEAAACDLVLAKVPSMGDGRIQSRQFVTFILDCP